MGDARMTAATTVAEEHRPKTLRELLPETMAFEHVAVPLDLHHNVLTVGVAAVKGDVVAALEQQTGLEVRTRLMPEAEIRKRLVALYVGVPERSAPKALSHLTKGQALELLAIPLATTVAGELVVAVTDAANASMLTKVAAAANVKTFIPVELTRDEIKERIKQEYVTDTIIVDDSPTQRLLHEIFVTAQRLKASDIHIDEFATNGTVEFRVRGRLRRFRREITQQQARAMCLSLIDAAGIVTAAMELQPLDGRISRVIEGFALDARFARLPIVSGKNNTNHSVVLRLSSGHELHRTLEENGMRGSILSRYRRASRYPEGLIIVSAKNRQGKSTTIRCTLAELYASMEAGELPMKRFRSVEDPVEAPMEWVRQTQQRDDFVSFDDALDQFVRMDTDLMFLGEMRDVATINSAITAALLGGLVFTTTHSRSAPGTIRRLLNKKVDPDDIADALVAVVGQRLVPVLCDCALDTTWDEGLENFKQGLLAHKHFGSEWVSKATLKMPREGGCEACAGDGFRSETGIFELLEVTDTVADLISQRRPIREIAAADPEYRPMVENAIELILEGKTTVAEVKNVVRWPWE